MTNPTLQRIISEHLGVAAEQVTSDASFESLGADSLDTVELAMVIEQKFDVIIEDEAVESWKTVGDVDAYLSKLTG